MSDKKNKKNISKILTEFVIYFSPYSCECDYHKFVYKVL